MSIPIVPKAKKTPVTLQKHGDVRVDNYFWMNDKEDSEVLDYIKAENNYCDEILSHTKDFQNELFEEMKGRIKEDDETVPYKFNGYWYAVKFEKKKEYPIYTRRKESLEAQEEILFDCNEMAKGHSYFKLTGISISPDNNLVSFGLDVVGRRQYEIRVKNLATGEIFDDGIKNATGSVAWAADNSTFFYTSKNEQTLRADKIYRHQLGATVQEDVLIYQENDDTFGTIVYKTKSRKYILISCYSTLTTEYRILEADNPFGEFRTLQKRERGHEYSISHYGTHFYIITNSNNSVNFRLMRTEIENTSKKNWVEIISHREDVLLESIDIFKDFLVLTERTNGLNRIRIKKWNGGEDYYLPFESEAYMAYTTTNVDFNTKYLRYSYNSLTTPASIIDFDMEQKTQEIKKEQEVLGGTFNKENYLSQRIWAEAPDGVKVPISLVYHKDSPISPETPLLLYAYGSYGHTIDPYFSTIRLSLLDRGFIYAIAHVRGSEYLGREWYDTGKLEHKKNTFNDFIACSEHLIENNYTSSEHLYAMGGSAGGLLMGVIANWASNLYKGIVAQVPFVDVISTMLDDSIPLTTGEYDEWGNPNDKDAYNYIKSYSPYDHVEVKSYPNMLVTSGLHDSQVQFWEPTKWVAKLRELKTDDNILVLRTNMDAGHGGASGRFQSLREDAEEFAFILNLEDINS